MFLAGTWILILTILHETYSETSRVMQTYVNHVQSQENQAHPQHRLSEAEWGSYNIREPHGPGTYAFGYDIEDEATGNVQFRQEERLANGTVLGSYGHVEPTGNVRIVHYIADSMGYRVKTENSNELIKSQQIEHNNIEENNYQMSTPSPLLSAAIVSQQLLNAGHKVQESHWRPADKPQTAMKKAFRKTDTVPPIETYPKGGKYKFYYVPSSFYQNSFK